MFEQTAQKLQSGDRSGASVALSREIGDLFERHFVAGHPEHPALGGSGRRLVDAVKSFASSLVADPARGHYVDELLHDTASLVARREDRVAVVFLFNHAMHLLLPDYPLVVSGALDEARAELGERIREGEFKDTDEARLTSIEGLDLSSFDAPEDVLPELPRILGIERDALVFACPSCQARRQAPVESAGDAHGCECGTWTRVPIPGLVRLGAWLTAKREKAWGLGRCRICGARVQTGRSGFMRAGFCSALCAKEGREKFREFVPTLGLREGESVAFACACGVAMLAPAADVGTRIPCACGVQVWVPEPQAEGKPSLAPCTGCGRPMKSSAGKCLYCGAVRSPARA